jgi:ppGpp synthetase/RelA/SpoT-type nucleotidyltranferase
MKERRREALLDIGGTLLGVIILIPSLVHLLVSRPLADLLASIERLEQGYPFRLSQRVGARELRWLQWRFLAVTTSLANSARLLVGAHRRAVDLSVLATKADIDIRSLDPLDLDRSLPPAGHDLLRRYLQGRLVALQECRPGDREARDMAVEIWERDAFEAERLGDMELRNRLEDKALSIMDPHVFARVSDDLHSIISGRAEWLAATASAIEKALSADHVPLVSIQQRSKHVAGVWRKMQEKGLRVVDLADLLAFRLIVPSLEHCYLALDTVHRLYEPEPFRFKDYIAHPKANGYRSVHTSVRDQAGFAFEIQIRSVEMHRAAEKGNAAHWRYRKRKGIKSRMAGGGLPLLSRLGSAPPRHNDLGRVRSISQKSEAKP